MPSGPVLALCAMLAGGYLVYNGVVKPVAVKVVHVTKVTGHAIGHGVVHLVTFGTR